MPKIKHFTGNFYTDDQLKQLLELFRGSVVETPVLLTATYGLRRSEVLGLKWSAIDFKHKVIIIRHTVVGSGSGMISMDTTKTYSSTRSLPLLPNIEQYLLEVKDHQEIMRCVLGKKYHKGDYACTWNDGRLISPDYLSCKFKKILKQSDLPVYRYHDLRHSAASLLVSHGFSLKEIAEWLGHSSVGTTNRYAHLQFKSMQSMGSVIGDKLFSDSH